MANKVKYGLSKVYYAKATIDPTTNTATYATPVALPGAVSLSLDAQGDQTKFRADNIDYWIGNSNNGYEGDLELALLPDSFKKDILGYVEDGNGILIEDAGATGKPFALLFQFEGDVHGTRHVLYNCSASRPSVSGQTTEETIDPNTETVSISSTAIHNAALGKDIVKASAKADDAAYADWYTKVYEPKAAT